MTREIAIGIIGGTRGMGKWFADFLQGRGFRVHVSGRTAGMRAEEMAGRCPVVVVSVPITATGEVIARVGPLLQKEQLLMDLTSLKAEPVQAMLKSSVSEVIGCHPLFGPQAPSPEGRHVVLCPARTGKWLPWLKDILEKAGAQVTETTPELHDELMSVVQGLNHLNTVMMGLALSRTAAPLSRLNGYTTPLFDLKSGIVEKTLTENPRLYAEILCSNRNMKRIVEIYEQAIGEVKASILRGEAGELTGLMREAGASLWPEKK